MHFLHAICIFLRSEAGSKFCTREQVSEFFSNLKRELEPDNVPDSLLPLIYFGDSAQAKHVFHSSIDTN